MHTLFDFDGESSEPRWVAVNDDVMGGRSSGQLTVGDGVLTFSGTLSLANHGGFSSVRTVDYVVNLSSFNVIVLRVLGDARRYQLRLQTDAKFCGTTVSYCTDFVASKGEWRDVRLSLDALQPKMRGTFLNGPPFDPSEVSQMGILIGDKQEGPFTLAIDWIGVE